MIRAGPPPSGSDLEAQDNVTCRYFFAVFAGLVLPTSACATPLSTLDTAGRDADHIATLFWWMLATGGGIWAMTMAVGVYCARTRPTGSLSARHILIIGGGVVFPTLALGLLLALALPSIDTLADAPTSRGLRIRVSGEQWWWRIHYESQAGAPVVLANELWLPVGERAEVHLASTNVIHAFWIPSISGKVDMIPGRSTFLSLEPTRTGVFGGVCAEFCGTSHALMAFDVNVVERAVFDVWLANQAQPAHTVTSSAAVEGARAFLESGCGACHTIRGTEARGTVGPDLTHVGSRRRIAAGTLPNDIGSLDRWIGTPDTMKPHARMPAFEALGAPARRRIAAYLHELR